MLVPDENSFPSENNPHDDDVPFDLPHASDEETPDEEIRATDDPPLQDKPVDTQADVDTRIDDDVPFVLPHVEEYDYAGPDEDTDDMPAVTAPNQAILDDKSRPNRNNLPTMPIPREPGMPDPKKTVEGNRRVPAPTQTVRNRTVRPEDAGVPRPQPSSSEQRYQRPAYDAPQQQTQPASGPVPKPDASRSQQRPQSSTKKEKTNGANNLRARVSNLGCMNNGCMLIFGGIVASFCGGLTIISLVLLGVAQARLTPIIQEGVRSIDEYDAFQSTFYYDRDGDLLFEDFNEGRRVYVPLAQMPQNLIEATVALEDDTFYSNPGIDVPATIRATLQFTGLMEGDTGGSTITQQLVRNIAFDYEYRTERSVRRKAEEIMLAVAINQRLSKEEILELYLNEVYYGNLAYGAQAASQTVFGKDVEDLTLGESALLAGLPQSPAALDPLNPSPDVQQAVLTRWRITLNAMVNEGYITAAERDATLRQGLEVFRPDAPLRAPHFTIYAQQELEDLLSEINIDPEEIARGGYEIYTTVDLGLNNEVQAAVRDQISTLTSNNVSNGAVVVLKPLTGEIVAMVGSADYDNEAIDGRVNVATSLRQPGSTMKPFTYAAAIENGLNPADVLWDTTVRSINVPGQSTWPVNYDRTYHGPVNMRAALASSYNVPAVKALVRAVGVEGLLNFLNRFGMESLGTDASRYGPSLTLGGGEVTLRELTQAFSVFANQGVLVPTTSILCVVETETNAVLYQYEGSCPAGNVTPTTIARTGLGTQVLDPRIAYTITDMMADNVARSPAMGSNSPLRTDGIASSVKTGTTNDIRDNWTVGYTRNVAVGVWVGNSDGQPMRNSSGLTGAAPIWNRVITTVYQQPAFFNLLAVDGTHQADQPNPPQGISLRRVCDVSRLTDGTTDCQTTQEWILDGPAGVPTADGGFVYRDPTPAPNNQPQPGQPFQQEVSPGVVRVLVNPIPQNIAAGISLGGPAGVGAPPPPRYCQVPADQAGNAPGARELLFLKPPPDPADAVEAERWAQARNIAFLPTVGCSQDLLTATSSGPIVLTAVITQPVPGQTITEGIPILGTVQFSPEQADYYKLEIRGGQFGNWTTIGATHPDSVINGVLEFLPGFPGLQPGDYQVRLAVVGNGNYVQDPYTVNFRVAQP